MTDSTTCCFGPCGIAYAIQQIFFLYTLVVLLWGTCKIGVVFAGILQDAFD